jgi:hypothetical protein
LALAEPVFELLQPLAARLPAIRRLGGRTKFGHRWSIATHFRDVAPADMQKAMQSMCNQQKMAQPA